MPTRPLLRALVLTLTAAFVTQASAGLPGRPKSTHPYLYASADDIAALRAKIAPPTLPSAGTMEMRVKPGQQVADIDPNSAVLMGSFPDYINHFFVRYGKTEGDNAVFVVGFGTVHDGAPASYPAYPTIKLPFNKASLISITWNTADKTILVDAEGNPRITLTGVDWQPKAEHFHFVGFRDQVVSSLRMLDKSGNVLWDGTSLDRDLAASFYGFIGATDRFDSAYRLANRIKACQLPMPTNLEDVCNVATAGRGYILDPAKKLGLAYKLTNEDLYRDAALHYVQHILSTPSKGDGDEWSMGARVAALGVLYDWFYDELDATTKLNIQNAIIDTIKTDLPGPRQDLINSVCGTKGLSGTTLACADKPDLDRAYISGHQASAMTGIAIGLLAIANERSEGDPMLDTIYDHLVNGLLPAREYISADGGSQTLFAYNANVGEVAERLVMWRRALNPPPSPSGERILQTKFMKNAINPYIYGMRAGGAFPVTGDYFGLAVTAPEIGYAALAGATEGNGAATMFYEEQVKGRQSRISQQWLWDSLYFPETKEPRTRWSDLHLSARYQVSGNVFMRDTWEYDNAVLLDFKSSTFSSENHQHLDQNSFSLFYKEPLLLDSGEYDEYNTAHWFNYYRRTIAHNSIVMFDPSEKYMEGTTEISNDGGQWYKDKSERYPTLDEIKPGGKNALQGIANFEDKGAYAYVSANAAQAYQASVAKLDPNDGFRRRIVYLRRPDQKPVVLVHDRVHALKPLPAVSLLHTAVKPTAAQVTGDTEGNGRYTVQGNTNLPLTVTGSKAKLTIEPLLPKAAHIKFVGGAPGGADVCGTQVLDAKVSTTETDTTDCRFTVRAKNKDGALKWTNFAPRKSWSKGVDDWGTWRIEISQVPEGQTATFYQYFLNVLRPDDLNSNATQTSTLLASRYAHAVTVDSSTSVVFADVSTPTTLSWKPINTTENVVVTGLVPSALYRRSFDQSTGEWVLTKVAAADSNTLTSSSEGVIYAQFAH